MIEYGQVWRHNPGWLAMAVAPLKGTTMWDCFVIFEHTVTPDPLYVLAFSLANGEWERVE